MVNEVPNMQIRVRRPRRHRIFYSAVVVIALLAQISCSSEASLRAADDHLIVPGTRIGPFKLGITEKELFQVGIPSGTRPWNSFILYTFGDRVVQVSAQSRRVERIFSQDRSDRTSAGVGMGSSIEDLFRALGPPERSDVGDNVCGVPGQLERVFYQAENMLLSFNRDNASCADAATKRVQYVIIKVAGSESFPG
jgi:hypothetical protein